MTDTPRRASFDATAFDADGGGAPYRCSRCGRPFENESWLALHNGHAHPGDLSEEEIDAFQTAHAEEETDLGRFRLLALGGLVLIYFGLLLIYAILAL